MEEDKFDKLLKELSELRKSHRESEDKLTTSLKEFRKEVSSVQEKTAKDLAQKISKSNYTFQKKGHEHQFHFNSGVQETIATARSELEKLAMDPSDKDALSKVDACLDEGTKALQKRQKHIMIADTSDWGAVRHYEADLLADNSDDEKRIKRAKKASKKEAESAGYTSAPPRKRRGGGQGGYRRRRPQWVDQPGPSRRDAYQPPPLMAMGPQYQYRSPMGQYPNVQNRNNRPRVLGPCFSCGAYGHLAASCGAKDRQYPWYQPVVSSAADVFNFVDQSDCGTCVNGTAAGSTKQSTSGTCVDSLAAGTADHKKCVDSLASKTAKHKESVDSLAAGTADHKKCVDSLASLTAKHKEPVDSLAAGTADKECVSMSSIMQQGHMTDTGSFQASNELCLEAALKFWEVESSVLQITDVQGRLRDNIAFGKMFFMPLPQF